MLYRIKQKIMKKQTAIQELITWIDEISSSVYALTTPQNELNMLMQFRSKLSSTLPKEREQIEKAYNLGLCDGQNSIGSEDYPGLEPKGAENYFNETYITQDK